MTPTVRPPDTHAAAAQQATACQACSPNDLPTDAPASTPKESTVVAADLETARAYLRAAVDARLAAEATASAERDRYRDLFECTPVGLVVTDAVGVIAEANQAARRPLSPGPRPLTGRPLAEFVWDQDQEPYRTQLAALHRGEPAWVSTLRFVPPRPAAEPLTADVTVVPFRDPVTRAPRFRWQLVDGTDRRRAAGEVARLEDADRRKDRFVAVLAHELRNPLTPLLTAAQVLAAKGAGDPAVGRAVGIITRQADRLGRLVEDLLDVARIAQGKVALHPDVVDLRSAAEAVAEAARSRAAVRRVKLSVTAPSAPVWVLADQARLDQVVANLIDNAVKYTGQGGSVVVAVERDGDRSILRVTDTGDGIAADLLPHVFDLYAQADSAPDRAGGGLGIGLAVVKQLVQLHGGTVEAASDGPDRGSTFVVRLPAAGNAPTNK